MIIRPPKSGEEVSNAFFFVKRILVEGGGNRNEDFYISEFKRTPELILVADNGKGIIGAIMGFIEGDHVLLGELAVDIKFQSQGIGSKLLTKFENNARCLGQKKILLGSYGSAEEFYLKRDYIPKLFVQIDGSNKEKALNSFLEGLSPTYEVTWKDISNNWAKAIIQTGSIDKELQEKAKSIEGSHTQYLFLKNL